MPINTVEAPLLSGQSASTGRIEKVSPLDVYVLSFFLTCPSISFAVVSANPALSSHLRLCWSLCPFLFSSLLFSYRPHHFSSLFALTSFLCSPSSSLPLLFTVCPSFLLTDYFEAKGNDRTGWAGLGCLARLLQQVRTQVVMTWHHVTSHNI